MAQPREDDLFKESTMTFGEHLEELRTCLFKSLVALVIGFIVGLMVGGYVANFIQMPLSKALTNYHEKEDERRLEAEMTKLEESGQTPLWTKEELRERIYDEHLFSDAMTVDSKELLSELKKAYPDLLKDVPLPPSAPRSDIRLHLWHHSEDDPRVQTKSMGTAEPFSVYVKASLLVGVLLSSPWVFYYIWHFVAAGLYPHERHYVQMYLPFSLGLFLTGAALAFFVVFEPVLNFLLSFNRSMGIAPEPRINEWLGFVLILPVGFGIGFQLPLIMLFMERIGIFTVRSYLSQWRIAVLGIFVLAALVTPPDPYSMLLMAFALTFLYFGGILLCKLMPRKPNPFGEASGR